MTAVIEVGPAAVSGVGSVDSESALAALEFVDSGLALVGERPVPTDELWRDVLRFAAGGPVQAVVLICPTWWPPRRIDRVRTAAQSWATDVVVLTRAEALRAAVSAVDPAVVEIGLDCVVVTAGDDVAAVPRVGDPLRVGQAATDAVGIGGAVVIDAPADVPGAVELASVIAESVRQDGAVVMRVDRRTVRAAAANLCAPEPSADAAVTTPRRRGRRGVAVLSGAVLSVAGLGVALTGRADPVDPVPDDPETLLVEGRVAIKVPAMWAVERVTDGPGSARVQVNSPDDPDTALLLTQSPVAPGTTPDQVADTLRVALADETPGVFTDFVPDQRREGRPVASYREIRPGRHIDWSVFVDGAVRIAVGCQGPPDLERQVGAACDRAIRSAHAIF